MKPPVHKCVMEALASSARKFVSFAAMQTSRSDTLLGGTIVSLNRLIYNFFNDKRGKQARAKEQCEILNVCHSLVQDAVKALSSSTK